MSIKVQLVTQQKALGTIITAGGVMGPDICLGVNRTPGAARPLEKQILRRKKLSVKAKMKDVHALSTSSLTYNHHVWNHLAKNDRNHIATKSMGPYRMAASMPQTNTPNKHFTNSEAIAKTGTACRCCQTEFHTFPRLLKHLAVAHRCRKSWHAWHTMTMEPLTEQQIADNVDAIATTTAANKKNGRQATFSEVPAYRIDITPLPLIETSPFFPKVYAAIQPTVPQPSTPKVPEPAERREVVFITDRPRQHSDLHQIMATSTISSMSGLDYRTIDSNYDSEAPKSDHDLQHIRDRITKGEIAAVYAELPKNTWYSHDNAEVTTNYASSRRSKARPCGPADATERIAIELHAANSITREILMTIHAAAEAKVPFLAIHVEESILWTTPESRHIIRHTSAVCSMANHSDIGTIKTVTNSEDPIHATKLKDTAAENFDYTAAAQLDEMIMAR
ncbi:unnamed protein product [Prorocentrum cordatum]|uniref:C2H2-type domain-containing protein n=1 Tax=Prorocentrum cordatum TaxID=2364126 RepID=A0ABN9Y5S5_9DINO|nr:unnamed protein product [Polarella glacialis]